MLKDKSCNLLFRARRSFPNGEQFFEVLLDLDIAAGYPFQKIKELFVVSFIWTCAKYVVPAFRHVSLCRSIFSSCPPQQNKRLPHGENEICLSDISSHLYYLIFFQRCICLEHTQRRFYWLAICCCAPKEVVNFLDILQKGNIFCALEGHFSFISEDHPWPYRAAIFSLLIFFLTGGKCHSYQWRTGGWSNNERVVWCQRSDGVNVTGE